MTKSVFTLLFLICLNFQVVGQKQKLETYAADAVMAKIPDSLTVSTEKIASYIQKNFTSENDKIRAIYYWTAQNISYDVSMPGSIISDLTDQEKIASALKKHSGVCMHYAEVFHDLATRSGITCYRVEGYTKQNGRIGDLAHIWNVAKIDNMWYGFDATWGAGYVDRGLFIKKFNSTYFKIKPEVLIRTHMPFDYLWQFSASPLTHQEFISGVIASEPKKDFAFEHEITTYLTLSDEQKAFQTAERIEKNGLLNNYIKEFYDYKRNEFNTIRQNNNVILLNTTIEEFNEAVSLLNNFIYYRNSGFNPLYKDEIIKEMIQTPYDKIKKCHGIMGKLGSAGPQNAEILRSTRKSVSEAMLLAEENYKFLTTYLSLDKAGRKKLISGR